ncbi:MAG: hypothetical protein V3T86_00950 [Planctomycetota bacterium]
MRLGIVALVTALIAGGCGGSGSGNANLTFFESLLPLENTDVGTLWCFRVRKVHTRPSGAQTEKTEDRYFKFGRIDDPTGPEIYTVSESSDDGEVFGTNMYGIRRTLSSLEMMFGTGTTVTTGGIIQEEFDVDVLMPGMRVANRNMSSGETFTNTLVNAVTDYSLTWVGPEAVPGHFDAERFDFSIDIPHATDTISVVGTVWVVQDVGPVQIVVTKTTERADGTKIEEYTATLEDTE